MGKKVKKTKLAVILKSRGTVNYGRRGRELGTEPSLVCTRPHQKPHPPPQMEVFMCTANDYEWDAFIQKCAVPPSPSCSLVSCISSCVGRQDGHYPSCFSCQSYVACRNGRDQEVRCPDGQEFNAHSGQCEHQRSPTCVRPIRRVIDFTLR